MQPIVQPLNGNTPGYGGPRITGADSIAPAETTTFTELQAAMNSAGVSIDVILYMLQKRMADVDGQISDAMHALEDRTNRSNEISKQIEVLQQMQVKGKAGSTKQITIDASLKSAETLTIDGKKMSPLDAMKEVGLDQDDFTLKQRTEIVDGKVVKLHAITMGQLETMVTKKREEITQINSGNELDMVRLQTLMQQRTQILTLGSNLLKSLNEAQESIIRNIG
ncbi:MAG: hypothetical protein R3A78_06745 [Polyangiales bacterium]